MSLSDDHIPCPEQQTIAINKFRYLIAQSDGNCPITHDTITRPVYTLCGHIFEFDALVEWHALKHLRCPFCNYMNPYALMHPTQASAEYFIKRLVREYACTSIWNLPYMKEIKATG